MPASPPQQVSAPVEEIIWLALVTIKQMHGLVLPGVIWKDKLTSAISISRSTFNEIE
ncbi:hypothetical protein O9929_17805 [Vibrio lentus]|nr:hypothetical protein [Vibrio lentus]